MMVQVMEQACNFVQVGKGERQVEISSKGEISFTENGERTVIGVIASDGVVTWPFDSNIRMFRELTSMLILHLAMPAAIEGAPKGDAGRAGGRPDRLYHRLLSD